MASSVTSNTKNGMAKGIVNLLSPSVSSFLSSNTLLQGRRKINEFGRNWRGASHDVLFFHKVNDPYSYLLLQMLRKLTEDFNITLKPLIVSDLEASTRPEPELLDDWSIRDARILAEVFDLTFPHVGESLNPELCIRVEKLLLTVEKSDNFLTHALDLNHALWNADEVAITQIENEIQAIDGEQHSKRLIKNQKLLKKKGHYSGAMLYYGGEWYWGVDRLLYLAQRFESLGIQKKSIELSSYRPQKCLIVQDNKKTTEDALSQTKTLDFYFSFRSPYSYLAAQRIQKLKKIQQFPLNIKPVLPMVMRGLPVPKSKRMYIVLDTKRECESHGIAFGKIIDPLGDGVNRCMSIYPFALEKNLGLEYICSISKGIWSEGKDVTKDSVLQKLCERAGLEWHQAKLCLSKTDWKDTANNNTNDLNRLGLWGVPSFQYGKQSYWGQDRLWIIENEILATT